MSEKKVSLLEGFKVFLTRGNVIDLAVAVVIGAAFTNIVNAVVKGVINPLVGAFGTQDLDGYRSCLRGPCTTDPKTGRTEGIEILWGSVLSAALSFLITAAVVYFLMVLPMAKYLARRAAAQAAKEGVQETLEVSELEVLKEIRDALVAQRSSGTPDSRPVSGESPGGTDGTGEVGGAGGAAAGPREDR
ncbi:large conductance mechanosensitive channel protein MscL [Streptomyces sp. NPDC055107]